MKDLETKNLKIRKFKMDDVEDVYKNLATIQELKSQRLESLFAYR